MPEDLGYEPSPVEDSDLHQDPEEANRISFFVSGDPIPKGSMKSYYVKSMKRIVTTNANPNTSTWQQRIAYEAQRANESRRVVFYSCDSNCGYEVETEFRFARPKSLPKKHRLNTKRPDLDKLIRTVLDGLASQIIYDDSQVVSVKASKRYVVEGETPGVQITVNRVFDHK